MPDKLTPKAAIRLEREVSKKIPSLPVRDAELIPGGSIEVRVTIRDWTPENIAAQPDPGRWKYITCELRAPKSTDYYFGDGAPAPQAIERDGQTFIFEAKPGVLWVKRLEHLEVRLSFCDQNGNPPQYGSELLHTLRIVKG